MSELYDDEIIDIIDDGDAEVLPDIGPVDDEDIAGQDKDITDITDADFVDMDPDNDDLSDDQDDAMIDDGLVVAECIGAIKAGDRVAVLVQDGRMIVLGSAGEGDRQNAMIDNAEGTATESKLNKVTVLYYLSDSEIPPETPTDETEYLWSEDFPEVTEEAMNIYVCTKSINAGDEIVYSTPQTVINELFVRNLFAQNITATGTIKGAKLIGANGEFTKGFNVMNRTYYNADGDEITYDEWRELTPEERAQYRYYESMDINMIRSDTGISQSFGFMDMSPAITRSAELSLVALKGDNMSLNFCFWRNFKRTGIRIAEGPIHGYDGVVQIDGDLYVNGYRIMKEITKSYRDRLTFDGSNGATYQLPDAPEGYEPTSVIAQTSTTAAGSNAVIAATVNKDGLVNVIGWNHANNGYTSASFFVTMLVTYTLIS